MCQQEIEESGFAVLPKVLPADEMTRLIAALSDPGVPRTRAGVRHALRFPAVAEIAADPRLLNIAKKVLGSQAIAFGATLFHKSPSANWLVAWHQDTALPIRERRDVEGWGPWSVKDGVSYAHAPTEALRRVLALRLHLDDSTLENGPLRVLPGTHILGVLSDDAIHELASQRPAVECTVEEGGILAMRPLIVHASSKSKTQASRRVLHIEYAATRTVADGIELAIG